MEPEFVNVGGVAAISNPRFAAFGPVKQWPTGGENYSRSFNLDGEITAITYTHHSRRRGKALFCYNAACGIRYPVFTPQSYLQIPFCL